MKPDRIFRLRNNVSEVHFPQPGWHAIQRRNRRRRGVGLVTITSRTAGPSDSTRNTWFRVLRFAFGFALVTRREQLATTPASGPGPRSRSTTQGARGEARS